MNARNLWFLSALAVGLAADQLTKSWVVQNLRPHSPDEVHIIPGWFSFVHAQNTGAAFSTMEGMLGVFLVFTVIALVVMVFLVRQQPTHLRFIPMTFGMILSGALGNGLDRLRQGYVTDFLKVYAGPEPARSWFIDKVGTNVWPIFNVADSLLLVGVTLCALYWALQREGELEEDEEEGAAELTG